MTTATQDPVTIPGTVDPVDPVDPVDSVDPIDAVDPATPGIGDDEGARRAAPTHDDAGLTGLQELAIAILVVAILVVGGLFAFGAFKGSANNSVAQQTAVNTLQDAHGLYANNSSNYPSSASIVGTLTAAEPGYTFANGNAVTGAKKISLAASSGGQQLVMAVPSASGNCYYVVDNQIATPTPPVNANIPAALGTWYGYTTTGACDAATAPAATALSENAWGAQW
jgi:type II secretory pathway pseudopilin PulG